MLRKENCHQVNETYTVLCRNDSVGTIATGSEVSPRGFLLAIGGSISTIRMGIGGLVAVPELHHLCPILAREILERLDNLSRNDRFATPSTVNA